MIRSFIHLLVVPALLCAPLLIGCGGAQQREAHEVLNAITDVADPTYQMAVDACDAARDAIIAREGTTYEDDRAAMDRVHEICDPMVLGFEALRASQVTARVAIDSGDLGATAATAVAEALELWNRLRRLVPQLSQLTEAPRDSGSRPGAEAPEE